MDYIRIFKEESKLEGRSAATLSRFLPSRVKDGSVGPVGEDHKLWFSPVVTRDFIWGDFNLF